MRREHVRLGGPGSHEADLIAYGHFGRPVLVFPAEAGRAWDFENNGMIDAVADLIEAGRVKLYCIDSADAWTWSDRGLPTEERARRHGVFERWVTDVAAVWISDDCHGAAGEILTVGASLGAFHAANFALKHADRFPLAICMSGNYDPTTWHSWGDQGDATYFNNPFAYVPNFEGGHLDWLRLQVNLLLIVGQGDWETHPTNALPSTRALAQILQDKGIRHELDVWGHDVPHDWPSWQRQLRHHLPRFC